MGAGSGGTVSPTCSAAIPVPTGLTIVATAIAAVSPASRFRQTQPDTTPPSRRRLV
jgi:hypothetical protein